MRPTEDGKQDLPPAFGNPRPGMRKGCSGGYFDAAGDAAASTTANTALPVAEMGTDAEDKATGGDPGPGVSPLSRPPRRWHSQDLCCELHKTNPLLRPVLAP